MTDDPSLQWPVFRRSVVAAFQRSLTGGQRDFHVAMLIADPRHLDRHFLVGQIHRAALTRPTHMARQSPLAGIPGARQALNVRLQLLPHLVEGTGINAWINATRASMSGAVVTGAGTRPTCFPFLRICRTLRAMGGALLRS